MGDVVFFGKTKASACAVMILFMVDDVFMPSEPSYVPNVLFIPHVFTDFSFSANFASNISPPSLYPIIIRRKCNSVCVCVCVRLSDCWKLQRSRQISLTSPSTCVSSSEVERSRDGNCVPLQGLRPLLEKDRSGLKGQPTFMWRLLCEVQFHKVDFFFFFFLEKMWNGSEIGER